MEINNGNSGGSSGGTLTVTDGITTVTPVTNITFTSNATVTNGGGGIADVAISGGSGSPGGADTQVQFNDGGSFGGDAGLTYNKTTDTLTATSHSTSLLMSQNDSNVTIDLNNGILTNASTIPVFNWLTGLFKDSGNNNSIDIFNHYLYSASNARIFDFSGVYTRFVDPSSAQEAIIDTSLLTAQRTQILPDKDGTFAMLSDITGGGVSGQATVDFGAITQEDSMATVTVATASALTASKILVSPAGVATADHDPDDYQWDNLSGYVSNIVDGVSFDITGVAPNGTWGQYAFNYVIN